VPSMLTEWPVLGSSFMASVVHSGPPVMSNDSYRTKGPVIQAQTLSDPVSQIKS